LLSALKRPIAVRAHAAQTRADLPLRLSFSFRFIWFVPARTNQRVLLAHRERAGRAGAPQA
jgi:hypothetical protein